MSKFARVYTKGTLITPAKPRPHHSGAYACRLQPRPVMLGLIIILSSCARQQWRVLLVDRAHNICMTFTGLVSYFVCDKRVILGCL